MPSIFSSQRYENEKDVIYSEELDVHVASLAELKEQRRCSLCQLIVTIHRHELTDRNAEKEKDVEHFSARKDPRKIYSKLGPSTLKGSDSTASGTYHIRETF